MDFSFLRSNKFSGTLPELGDVVSTSSRLSEMYTFASAWRIPPLAVVTVILVSDLGENNFVGTIPQSFGNIRQLASLYINHEFMTTHVIPYEFSLSRRMAGCLMTSLCSALDGNNFEGFIPTNLFSVVNLYSSCFKLYLKHQNRSAVML